MYFINGLECVIALSVLLFSFSVSVALSQALMKSAFFYYYYYYYYYYYKQQLDQLIKPCAKLQFNLGVVWSFSGVRREETKINACSDLTKPILEALFPSQ